MKLTDTYRLSGYQDYGPLETKDHIHLVRAKNSGKICVKKTLDTSLKDVIDLRMCTKTPYFPAILEVIEAENGFIIIEEYIEGVTLEDFMMGTPLSEDLAVHFAVQICQALRCLHENSPMIIYRDLKSENIMITPQNEVRLIDFHISRQFQEGKKRDTALLGTAEYAAPEQFGYFQTDNRTDIYAFGVLFNYMLTGKFPIESISGSKYAKIIRKCTALEPDKRYQRVDEILQELGYAPDSDKSHDSPSAHTPPGRLSIYSSWAIPGFRSDRLWKKFIAVLGYTFILYIGLTLKLTRSDGTLYTQPALWVNRVVFTISQLATIFYCANYRGISRNVKLLHSRFWPIRICCRFIVWLMFLILAIMATVIIETIFSL